MNAHIVHPWPDPPAVGETTEVSSGVLWIRMPLPVKPDHVNIYALEDGDGWTLIDTGLDTRETRKVWQVLIDGPLGRRPVDKVIATHHHPDHLGLAGWFIQRGAEFWTTRTAWLMARMIVLDEQERPVPEAIAFWQAAGMQPGLIAQRANARPFNFSDVVHPLPLGYFRIKQGDTLRIGGRLWKVIIGNGHAPEHATFWSMDDDLVIGGDHFLSGISPNIGVYSTEPKADPLNEWLDSCKYFSTTAEDRHLVLPGHKLPFTGLPMRLVQLYENHIAVLNRITEALAESPKTIVECFPALYRRVIAPEEFNLALAEAVAHINRLKNSGRIKLAGINDHGSVLWCTGE